MKNRFPTTSMVPTKGVHSSLLAFVFDPKWAGSVLHAKDWERTYAKFELWTMNEGDFAVSRKNVSIFFNLAKQLYDMSCICYTIQCIFHMISFHIDTRAVNFKIWGKYNQSPGLEFCWRVCLGRPFPQASNILKDGHPWHESVSVVPPCCYMFFFFLQHKSFNKIPKCSPWAVVSFVGSISMIQ